MLLNNTKSVVKVINLGRQKYLTALSIQHQYARKILDSLSGRSAGPSDNVLLMVEHDPVYTIGIRTSGYGPEDEQRLKSLGAEFHRTNRGGLITFHGPGQLVAYPVINLKDFGIGMRSYVHRVEDTVIQTCAHFGLKGKTTCDTGVWVSGRKIAAIGVHGSRYVTTHGTALNCNIDLTWFDHIVPCGLEDKEVTSLSKELQTEISIGDVTNPFLQAFRTVFKCDLQEGSLDESMRLK